VATETRTGIKRHKPEGLRRRRLNHFPDIDIQEMAHNRQFIDKADVDRAKRVFKKLAEFRRASGRDLNDFFDDQAVNFRRHFETLRCHASDDFGSVVGSIHRISRIDSFR